MRAGIFQPEAGGFDTSKRLDCLDAALQAASVDLVVCPELFLSGYDVGDTVIDLAETRDGPFAGRIAEIARATGTAIVYGYPERHGEYLYNSANCIGASGSSIANHRKLFFPPGRERQLFDAGDRLTVFTLNGVRCGILICYDAELPELVRATAEFGADVIIVPTALSKSWSSVAYQLIPTRAFENGVWILYANHAGMENETNYLGASCIVGPGGKDAARAGATEQLISAAIDTSELSAIRKRLPYVAEAQMVRDLIGRQTDGTSDGDRSS